MSIARIIAADVPVLATTDTVDKALGIMEENFLRMLPMVSEENYIALVTEKELMEIEDQDTELGSLTALQQKPGISIAAHPLEAMRILDQFNLAILPVLDLEQKYLGSVTAESMLKYFSEHSGIENPGGIIVLEIEPRNYSLYQIARICENEDVTILSSQLYTNPAGVMEVTLKTNRTSLDALVSSFERYEYKVIEVHGDPRSREDLMDKYKLLMTYLNM